MGIQVPLDSEVRALKSGLTECMVESGLKNWVHFTCVLLRPGQ